MAVAQEHMAEGAHLAVLQRADGPAVEALPKKKVSSKAMQRIEQAKAAIKHTKQVMMYGAGNQATALKATRFNSFFRMKAMREDSFWTLTDAVKPIAAANPDALTTAKAALMHGGNCGEHAEVAFDYLRVNDVGETINRSDVTGLDHAFVILGAIPSESDVELVVADPWPVQATATTWEDHFAYTDDRAQISVRNSMVADGKNVAAVIAAGLTLSEKGKEFAEKKLTKSETEKEITKSTSGAHPWIWDQPDTAAENREFAYYAEQQPPKSDRTGLQSPRFATDERLQAAYDNSRIMRIGERGEAVKRIQQALIDDGFVMPITTKDGPPDGVYGQETFRTVYQFQVKYGLKHKDGAVGHETMIKLDKLYRAG